MACCDESGGWGGYDKVEGEAQGGLSEGGQQAWRGETGGLAVGEWDLKMKVKESKRGNKSVTKRATAEVASKGLIDRW